MPRPILLLLTLALAAAHVQAGVKKKLHFKDGKSLIATLSSFDDTELTIGKEATEKKIPWVKLTPASAFMARKALTPFDDGSARLALATFARTLDLFPEAFEQVEIALALGALDENTFEKVSEEIEKEELTFLGGRIEALLKTGDEPAACLDAIKRLKERYPDHDTTKTYARHVPDLVARLEALAKQREEASQAIEEDAATKKVRKKIESILKKKAKALATADELMKEGEKAAAMGVISRVKKRYLKPRGAEKHLKQAQKYLRDIVRLEKRRFQIVPREVLQKDEDVIVNKLIEVYLAVTKAYMRDRNYKRAWEYVHSVLRYDPIHEEALEIRDEIKENRLTRKVSTTSNVKPRVKGG